jgi:transcriptional regulator with GAF, ATPase, and Fis domain
MKRRSKVSGELVKARRTKASKPKRSVKPNKGSSLTAPPADQAAEISRLNRELKEALEQQAAAADVLRVISSSAFDLQTVLDTLAKSAARLCEADAAAIWRPDGGVLKMAATFGGSSKWIEYAKQNPVVPDRGTVSGRVLLDGKVIHVRDVLADREFTGTGYYVHGNYRTSLGVPLSTKEETIGVFVIARSEVREFTDKQIKLVTTFADQAVIAIENARLLNELRQRTDDLTEALEQQTATSDVLQVISRSPSDLEPVFSTMLEKAVRICDADFGNIYRWDADALRLVATCNTPPAFADARRFSFSNRPGPKTVTGRMLAS